MSASVGRRSSEDHPAHPGLPHGTAPPASAGAAVGEVGEERLVGTGDGSGVETAGGGASGFAHAEARGPVVDELGQGGGHRLGVVDRNEQAVDTMLDDLGGAERAVG